MDQQHFLNKKSQTYYANQWAEAGVCRRTAQRVPADDDVLTDSHNEGVVQFRKVRVSIKKRKPKKSARPRGKFKGGIGDNRGIRYEEVS